MFVDFAVLCGVVVVGVVVAFGVLLYNLLFASALRLPQYPCVSAPLAAPKLSARALR